MQLGMLQAIQGQIIYNNELSLFTTLTVDRLETVLLYILDVSSYH